VGLLCQTFFVKKYILKMVFGGDKNLNLLNQILKAIEIIILKNGIPSKQ